MAFLSGYKTYVIAGLFIACVLAEKFAGFDIPGFNAGADWLETVLAALGLGALRAGLAKAPSQ